MVIAAVSKAVWILNLHNLTNLNNNDIQFLY